MVRTYFSDTASLQEKSFEKRLLQFSLFLPFVLPLLAGLIATFTPENASFSSGLLGTILGLPLVLSIYAIIFGGIPYSAILIAALIWSRGKSDAQIHFMIWFLPILFIPVFFLFWTFVSVLWSKSGEPAGGAALDNGTGLFMGLILVIGYAYVVPVSLTYLLIKTIRAR